MNPSPNIPVFTAIFILGMSFGIALKFQSDGYSNGDRSTQRADPQKPSTPSPDAESSHHPGKGLPLKFQDRLASIAAASNRFERNRRIASVADDLDAAQIHEAVAELEKTHFEGKNEILLRLMSCWGRLEPELAMQYARGLSIDPGLQAIGEVVKGWAESDPKRAEAWASKLPSGGKKKAAWAGLIDALSLSDPKHAFDIALSSSSFSNTIEGLFSNWVESNPEEAAAHATKLPAGYERSAAIHATAKAWARKNIAGAIAWAQEISGEDASAPWYFSPVLAAVLNQWIDEDAEKASEWVQQMPESKQKTKLLGAIGKSLATNDPERAVEFVAMMPSGASQDKALSDLALDWGWNDLDGALRWANEQTDSHVREKIVPLLAGQLAVRDPNEALQMAMTTDGEARREAVNKVLSIWAARDPVSAAAWLGTGAQNTSYFSSVALEWARKDSSAAINWITSIRDGVAKDETVSGVAFELLDTNPGAAAQWIAQIGEDQSRHAMYVRLAESWLQFDRKAALAWIDAAPLPREIKSKLLTGGRK